MKKGFTLIELVIVLVILGILAAIAIPRFLDLTTQAKKAACQGSLGAVRSAVAIWYAKKAVETGTATWPTLVELQSTTAGPMEQGVPPNPYTGTNTVVTGATKGTVTGTAEAWAYKPTTGEFWSNTSDGGSNAW